MAKNISVGGYKWYWRTSEGTGGVALLLDDTDIPEVQIAVSTPQDLAGLVEVFSTFDEVFYDATEKVLFTKLLKPGTTEQ